MKMQKISKKSMDLVTENVAKLKELFPEINCEGKIDLEKLKIILGDEIEENDEKYNFTWNGKKKALRYAQVPSKGTLRPCKEESVDWDNTKNLYIEGDNLEVLKLLQKSYFGKVKMIYIDPPYNTGNDFVYNDDYKDNIKNYLDKTNQIDGNGKKYGTNSEASGRYHTDWLNMMYPRLRLAKNLLRDDGVIFISIDDNEGANLKKICDEVYGEENFIAQVIWERAYSPVNLKKHFSENHDYMICYAKHIDNLICNGLKRSNEANSRYQNPDDDSRGTWMSSDLSVGPVIEEKVYEILTPSGRKVLPPNGYCWRYTKEKLDVMIKDNRIWFGETGNNVPRIKRFLSEVKDSVTPMTIWKYSEVGHSQDAKQKLKELFDNKAVFDYPKSVLLIKRIMELYTDKDKKDIVVDFFAGVSTTAHAVMQLNAEDSGNRKLIMVQLPEPTDEKSEAFKSGYKNICEIGKERIRRAGKKIKDENQENIDKLDIGFKVFKLDSSNIKEWNPDYNKLDIALADILDNFVDGRTEEDVLYEIIVKYGLDLTLPVETCFISEKKIFNIDRGALIACLDKQITIDVIEEIIKIKDKLKPEETRVVFKDIGFKKDDIKINAIHLLKKNNIKEIMSI